MLTTLPFYLLRSPFFSLENYFLMNECFKKKDINELKKIFSDENFLKAIYFSSRSFYHVVQNWIEKSDNNWNSNDKILESLYKYYTRMCTRCTPYGLFSGFAMGYVSTDSSAISLGVNTKPIFRADIAFIKRLKDQILRNNQKNNLKYYTNNSINTIDNIIKYIEWDDQYNYGITEINSNYLLQIILQKSEVGLTFDELVELVLNEIQEVDKDTVEGYIQSLIESKLIVDILPPYMTSVEDPLVELDNYLSNIGINTSLLNPVKNVLQSSKKQIKIKKLDELITQFENLIDESLQIFQIDLQLELEKKKINQSIPQILSKEVEEILAILPKGQNSDLKNFITQFSNIYEDQEISLVKALDPHLGIGYGLYTSGNIEITPLLENIAFSFPTEKRPTVVPPIIQYICDKHPNAFDPERKEVIRLSEATIKGLSNGKIVNQWAENYYLFGDLYANSLDSIDSGDFQFNTKSSLPTPYFLKVLGRFAYHDPELTALLKESLSNLDSHCIYAEMIHQPSDKIGNVLLRPEFYDFEIPYITHSKKHENTISINDIYVSVSNNTIKLRSKSLNKEIRPRFSTAYNSEISQLSLIKFLCDIQHHDITGSSWSWSVLSNNSFLPRVEYKHLILSEARWKLDKNESCSITLLVDNLKKLHVPQFCVLKEFDNTLLLDLENEIVLQTLLKKIRENDLLLFESFHDRHFITKGGKIHTSEFIFPYKTIS